MALEDVAGKIKEFYLNLEDKWYATIDKIDEKVPIHGIIDKVDKVFPSFALFLILIALILTALILPFFVGGGAVLSFKVTDIEGNGIENATVDVYLNETEIFTGTTNQDGETNEIMVPVGSSITITASKENFQEYAGTLEITESLHLHGLVLTALEDKTYTLSIKDSLGQPIREPLTLAFACRDSDTKPPADLTISSGIATVVEPAGCNGMIVAVKGEGFEFKDSVLLVQNQQTIFMQELLGDEAKINVELYFNGEFLEDGLTVYLYKATGQESGLGPIESALSQNGKASFQRQAGAYYVKTSGEGNYAAVSSKEFTLSAGETRNVRIDLEQNSAGTVRLRIVDRETNEPVDNANVLLRLGAEEIDTKTSSEDKEGLVEFPVIQDTSYTAVIDHEGYCLKTVQDASIGSIREIELTPFTDDCGGKLQVIILDQDGQPVTNAEVGLYTDTGFNIGFASIISDVNGMAEFSRVPSGDYKAFAFKGSTSGWSDAEHFAQRTAAKTALTVVLIAGDGTIKVNIRDDEGQPLQFSQVAFVDALTLETIGGGAMPVEDANGSTELTTRADKHVYVVVSKQGYTNFTSTIVPVEANSIQMIEATLEKEIIQGEIKAEFKGMYRNGRIAREIAPGYEYEALFQLRVPANKNYDSIGMHLRTGENEIMELDKVVLDEINAPGDVDVIKATSYSPNNGYDVDSGHLSADEAKWVSLRWPVFSTGIIQVMAKVKVKETANIGDQLKLNYRAWGEEGGRYKRDPLDTELGEAESVGGKEGLYANAKQEIFQIGTETMCDEKFCFSASILDIEEELSYSSADSFTGKIFGPYRLSFTILNNSEFDTDTHLDAEARIINRDSGLIMQEYTVYGAQNQLRQGTASEGTTGWLEIGNLLPNNQINGEIYFMPQKSGASSIEIEIRSGQRIRFSKTIALSVISNNKMDVMTTPELLPSGVENILEITVKNTTTGAELDGALAKIKDRFGTVIAERTTNKMGKTSLKLPALQPSENLTLTVGKQDYENVEKTISVNANLIQVKPQTIGVALNSKTMFETQDRFSMENITGFDMTIKSLEVRGKFYGIVDQEKINNWLYSYIGETVLAGETKEMVLMSFLTEKGKKLEEPMQLEAILDITTEAFGSTWTEQLPVKISIGLGGEVDDPTCFTITRQEWTAGTEGAPVEIQFEAQNNCSISSAPVSLRNISAKANWQTNQLGTFSLVTAENAIDIRSGYAKKFAGLLAPEESISIVLTFTPNAGVNGKGRATIVFSAENPTESGAQALESQLEAEMTVANIVDCISFSKDVLLIKPEDTDSFTVESIACGPTNDIRLESELTVSSEMFTLTSKDSREIEVLSEKNMAGQYPIRIYAKGSDEIQEKLIKTIRARILANGCLELSRYEFDIFDNPNNQYDGYDTVEVINHCYDKPVTVQVKYDEHDWGEAMKDGAIWGIAGALIGGFSAKAGGNTFFTGAAIDQIQNGLEDGDKKEEEPKEQPRTEIQPETISGPPTALWNSGMFDAVGIIDQYTGNGKVHIAPDGKGFTITEDEQIIRGEINNGEWQIGKTPIEPAPNPNIVVTKGKESTMPTGMFTEGLGGGSQGGLLGGLAGGMINGMGRGLLGKPSALGWGLQAFAIGTIMAYYNQDEGEFNFTTVQKDLEYEGIVLLMPGATLEENKLVETESKDIMAQDLDETSTQPRPEAPGLNMEKRKVGFLNIGNVIQQDPATPIFRILKIEGERVEYETEYDMDEKETPKIKEKERKQHKERFRLQFNAFDPMTLDQEAKPVPNCTLGTITGTTGPSAVPRVSFNWSWSEIGKDACDEGNEDYIYCDATQFSIATLKKVQELKEFIEANKPFDCPSSSAGIAAREQPLKGTAFDVGLTRIQANKIGLADANIIVTAESNNGRPMEASVRIDLKKGTGLVNSCTKSTGLISKSVVSCDFTGLAEADYTIEAKIIPMLCDECENNDTENDAIDTILTLGSQGMTECKPYNTKRLINFLEASNYPQNKIEEVQKLVNFNAFLIKDAYTKDFRADFDEFCKTKSFFDCPVFYLEETGLHRFFADNDRFEFDYSMAPHAPADAGKYAATINIEFDNDNWNFFDQGNSSAKVKVEMTELSTPEPDNPFYYLPFDGQVGIDSSNGRQGYGVNFRQTTEDTIKVNNAIDQTLVSTNIPGSTPIFNGWINAGFADDFVLLNQKNRGILLDVQAGGEATKIVLSPSYATPIMMQVEYEKGHDAYGFYSIEINSSPQSTALKMIPWSGVGVNCRDFKDNVATEAWQDTWDVHGGVSGNIDCAPGTSITDYGIEWCDPIRSGSTYLQSVVFTPQNKNSLMKRTTYGDQMTLYNRDDDGSQIALNGVPGMKNNSYGTSGIDSIEDVFELVRENKVCLVGQGNRISNKFFWNPKVILEELSAEKPGVETNCIKTS